MIQRVCCLLNDYKVLLCEPQAHIIFLGGSHLLCSKGLDGFVCIMNI
jgi:hypothetical protein